MKEQSMEAELAAFIGVDWGDERHHIELYEPGREVESIELKHSPENVHRWLKSLEERFGGRSVAVALEASKGALVSALLEYPWCVIYPVHPACSARLRVAFVPSGAKDDRPDAQLLLEIVRFHRHKLRPLSQDEESTRTLSGLNQLRRNLVDRRTQLTHELRSTLKTYFPQALSLVGESLDSPMALAFLDRWPELMSLKLARPSTVRSFYHAHNVRRPELIEQRLQQIKEAVLLTKDQAVNTVAQLRVGGLVAQVRLMQKQITHLGKEIARCFAAHPEAAFFRELPGAGPALAPRLLTAFGTDRTLYPQASSLQKYAGVAPVKEASGNREWVHWRRQAPVFVRQTFVEWAHQTTYWCEWARAYYEHYKKKKKSHNAILRALAFKWIRILWRCWQDGTLYDEARYMQQLRRKKVPYLQEAQLAD